METSVKLYSLPFGNVKTYLFVLLFVAGNIALPQLCHLVPAGGPTLLPIYSKAWDRHPQTINKVFS